MSSLITKFLSLSWLTYIVIALVLSLSIALYCVSNLYLSSVESSGKLKEQISELTAEVNKSNTELSNLKESCTITDEVVTELNKDVQSISEQSTSIDKEFDTLKESDKLRESNTLNSKVVTKVTTEGKSENVNNSTVGTSVYLPNDGNLNPSFISLLNKSYCSAEPEDSLCINPK